MSSNEKAFPSENCTDTEYNWINKGMDLRDYFAAKALQGIMANSEFGPEEAEGVAFVCYKMAQAMMKMREKE